MCANSYSAAIEQYEQALALREEYTDGSDVDNCLDIADLCDSLGCSCLNLQSLAGYEKAEAYYNRGRYFIRQLQSQKDRLTDPENIKMAGELMCSILGSLGLLYANQNNKCYF